jgi:hypothetical protein
MSRKHSQLQRIVFALGTLGGLSALALGSAAQPKPAPPAPGSAAEPEPKPLPPAQPQPQPQPQPAQPPSEPAPEAAAPPSEPAPSEPAAPPRKRKAATAPPEEEEPEPPLIPPAQDSLAGHFTLSPGVAFVSPFGSLGADLSARDLLGDGLGLSVEAAVGVSRTIALGVWGQALSFGSGNECPDCSGSSLAGGAFVRYHLVQGVRFDPWMSAGLGFRTTSIEGTPIGKQDSIKQDFSGIEWLRFTVGGDWYAFSLLGLGPFLELDMGIYGTRPDSAGDSAAHFQLVVGARITLDVPGK